VVSTDSIKFWDARLKMSLPARKNRALSYTQTPFLSMMTNGCAAAAGSSTTVVSAL
jgi:hypothetical protein